MDELKIHRVDERGIEDGKPISSTDDELQFLAKSTGDPTWLSVDDR